MEKCTSGYLSKLCDKYWDDINELTEVEYASLNFIQEATAREHLGESDFREEIEKLEYILNSWSPFSYNYHSVSRAIECLESAWLLLIYNIDRENEQVSKLLETFEVLQEQYNKAPCKELRLAKDNLRNTIVWLSQKSKPVIDLSKIKKEEV